MDRSWQSRSYREALTELVSLGWVPCGVGDWAIALRSPDGSHAARVCPFDPAYPAFLELCRRCGGNRYLPRVNLEAALSGGGSLTILEFLASAPDAAAAELVRPWSKDQGDAELDAVKTTALAVEKEYRARVSWWDGIDINPGNIRLSADHGLVLVDIFCMDRAALYGQVLEDAAVGYRRPRATATRDPLPGPGDQPGRTARAAGSLGKARKLRLPPPDRAPAPRSGPRPGSGSYSGRPRRQVTGDRQLLPGRPAGEAHKPPRAGPPRRDAPIRPRGAPRRKASG